MLILALVMCFGVFIIRRFNKYYDSTDYEDPEQVHELTPDQIAELIDPTGLSEQEEEDIKREVEKDTEDITINNSGNVYNLLLVGVDRRSQGWSGNADSIIILSIDHKNQKLKMTSLMRDLYADIPNYGVRKLNAACALGGCDLLEKTIEENYKVSIDNYAWVDFRAMIDIIDAIGGIDIDLSDAEANMANGLMDEMLVAFKESKSDHYFKGGGTNVHCDGFRAVAYSRIRFVGNADFQRTERQRTVLTKIAEKGRKMNVVELDNFCEKVLPLIHHNIDKDVVESLVKQASGILDYEIKTSRVPYDDMYKSKNEILVPEMKETIMKLHEDIYG